MIPISSYLYISAALFCIGIALTITKRNVIVVLMGIELMLNAANINLVAFSQYDERLQGQFFSLFVIVVAAAEVAVALAIVIKAYQHYRTADLDKISELKD
ncbi:MAG: NADH-quinone oxidoreductase subunit NuoK [Flammeovirgaceae bacterium]